MRTVSIEITGLNPEPWTVGTLSMGFKGGKRYPQMSKDGRLRDYQEGVADSIRTAYPDLQMFDEGLKLNLNLMYWRQLDEYTTEKGRKQKRHVADATNLTKALEDALQGILFKNDNQVKWSSGIIVAEGPDVQPRIMIACTIIPEAVFTMWDDVAKDNDKNFASGKEVRPFPGNVYIQETP